MLYNLSFWFILFILYSILGYIVEIISVSIKSKKIVFNRGFLIGPYLPIYGVGCLIMVVFLARYRDDLLVLFIMSAFYCSVLEYVTSLLMEKIFKLRWWDYSRMKFNLNGRICLFNSVSFGLGGILVVRVIHPFLAWLVYLPSSTITIWVASILFVIFMLDVVESSYITTRLRINFNKYVHVDATAKIKKEVQNAIRKNTLLTSRLLRAFPTASYEANKKFKEFLELFDVTKREVRIQKLKAKIKEEKKKKGILK